MVTMLLGGTVHGRRGFCCLGRAARRVAGGAPAVGADRVAAAGALAQTTAWKWTARILLFHAVCAGWVFFRATSFDLAFQVFGR